MLQVQYLNTVAADHMVIGTPQRGKRHPQITISTGSIDTPSRSPPHICILVISRTESMASLTSRRSTPPWEYVFSRERVFYRAEAKRIELEGGFPYSVSVPSLQIPEL